MVSFLLMHTKVFNDIILSTEREKYKPYSINMNLYM